MDFTMHCLLKNLAKLSLLVLLVSPAQAAEISPNQPRITPQEPVDELLQLNAKFKLNLSSEVIETLNAEIPLNFIIQIKLTHREQLFIFRYRTQQKEIKATRQLSYSVFEDSYFIKQDGKKTSYFNLALALEDLTQLENYPIIEFSKIYPGLRHRLKAQIKLDIWSLPAPLFTQTLFNKNWHLSSEWLETPLRINHE